MNKTIDINNLLLAVIFSSLGIVLPVLFHLVGMGSVFLPMFIPLAIGAYFMTPSNALLAGFFTPLLSALLTGMPPFYPPMAFIMMIELTFFCLVISLLNKKTSMPMLVILAIAVIIDRAILIALYSFILPMFNISFKLYTLYDILKSFPGIILMFILVPVLVPAAQRILSSKTLTPYEYSDNDEKEIK